MEFEKKIEKLRKIFQEATKDYKKGSPIYDHLKAIYDVVDVTYRTIGFMEAMGAKEEEIEGVKNDLDEYFRYLDNLEKFYG